MFNQQVGTVGGGGALSRPKPSRQLPLKVETGPPKSISLNRNYRVRLASVVHVFCLSHRTASRHHYVIRLRSVNSRPHGRMNGLDLSSNTWRIIIMLKPFFQSTAIVLLMAPAQAQGINCYGSSCSGVTRGGQPYQLNTYQGTTTGTVGGQPVRLNTYQGTTTGTIGGQSVRMNTYNGTTTGTVGGRSFACTTYAGVTNCN